MAGVALSGTAGWPEAALRWAEAALGERVVAVEDASWGHGEARVARLTGAGGAAAYLKAPASPRAYAQETDALGGWAARLPGTPRLRAAAPPPRGWLLTDAVPGELVHAWPSDDPRAVRVHRAAGAWLAALHALPFADDDPLAPAEALVRRVDAWAARAPGVLPAATADAVRARVRDLPARTFRRVRCHRDYSPRNWLWDERHGLGVIDFEHARPDVAGTDVARLHDGPWVARPELEVAFWDGYGRVPDADERAAHDAVRAVQAFATVLWARQHDDAGFEAEGRAALGRLGVPT